MRKKSSVLMASTMFTMSMPSSSNRSRIRRSFFPLKHVEGFVHVVGHIDRFFDKFILQIFHIAHAVEMEMSELLFVPAQHMVLQFVGHVFARLAVKFVDQAVRIFGRDEMGKQTASISIRSSYGSKVRWG
jgi:hypothetical protein